MAMKTDRAGAGFQLVVSDARGEKQTVVSTGGGGELSAPAWGPLVE
jgi:hypothetical protein